MMGRGSLGWNKGIVLGAGLLLMGLLTLALGVGRAVSMSNGIITGRSLSGCSPCHGVNPSPGVKVAINGPTKVASAETYNYTVTVSGGAEGGGGLNLSASQGRLSPGQNTQLVNGEITHQDRNSRSWSFGWTAPAVPGQALLRAAVNAANADGTPMGDAWNLGSLEIAVTAAFEPSVPAATAPESPPSPSPAPAGPMPGAPKALPALTLKAPEIEAGAGIGIILASLKDGEGKPISGANIKFYVEQTFFLGLGNVPVETFRGPVVVDYGAQEGTVKGLMEIGEARTNAQGIASFKYSPAISGDLKLVAKYGPGNPNVVEATALWTGAEHSAHYHPDIGIRTSFLKPSWILGILLGGIWLTFLFVLYQVYAISRE